MASVTRRRFCHKVSTVHLLDGTVDTTLIQRVQAEDTVEISVWEIIGDGRGERDRMERYVFDLSMEEVRKLIRDLQSHVA